MITKIYHDLDGVHADMHARVLELSGKTFQEIGRDAFWGLVNSTPDFFGGMQQLPDSKRLFEYTRHLPHAILTGLPLFINGPEQKINWVRKYLCEEVEVIVVPAKEKALYATPTTVLIDDTLRNIAWWKNAGGIGILHTSVEETLAELARLGVTNDR